MMQKAQAESRSAATERNRIEDATSLSDTSVHELLKAAEPQPGFDGARGIANGILASLVLWLVIGALVAAAMLLF